MSPINRNRSVVTKARAELEQTVKKLLASEKDAVVAQAVKLYSKLGKADDDDDADIEAMLAALDLTGLESLSPRSRNILATVAADGGEEALAQIGVEDADITALVNDRAVDYASSRAAELVGKKLVDGELVDNPNADYAITDSTREFLRADITSAVEGGWSTDKLASTLSDNYAFSDARAETIARTEIAKADVSGNMIAYRASGVVSKKSWLPDEDPCPICEENVDAGEIDLDDVFPSGDDAPPAHPSCLAGGTIITAFGVTAHYKRWFSGEVVVISVPGNNDLTITPNHPVLTQRGWVAAGELELTDSLVKAFDSGGVEGFGDPKNNHVETAIEDVAGSLLMSGDVATISVPSTTEDFHGDGTIDHEVDIILVNGELRDAHFIINEKLPVNEKFAGTGNETGALDSLGFHAELLEGHLAAPDGSVSGFGPRGSDGGGLPGGLDGSGLRKRPDFKPIPLENLPQRGTVAPQSLGEIAARFPGKIGFVKIGNLSRREFSSHVYNLSTMDHWYIAENIIVHNCECDIIAIVDEKPSDDEEN